MIEAARDSIEPASPLRLPELPRGNASHVPRLPEWYPAECALPELARAASAELKRLGYGVPRPEEVRQLVFTDADHTFLQTHAPVWVRRKDTGERFLDPQSGKAVAVALTTADYEGDYARLRAQHPDVRWEDYALDFTWYGSTDEIRRTKAIAPTLHALRERSRDELSRAYVITARSSEAVVQGLDRYLQRRGVSVCGVFAINEPKKMQALGLNAPGLDSAKRKALMMAALIQLHSERGGPPERVVFYDDSDQNLIAAMQLLPKLFPQVSFQFHDVRHEGRGVFKPVVVAVSSAMPGGLMRAHGAPLSDAQIAAYRSDDAPLVAPSLRRYDEE
jgi:hypothetical protein